MASVLSETLKVGDKDLFMSFGILNELAMLVLDPDELPRVQIDPEKRQAFLNVMLAERDDNGVINKPFNPIMSKMSVDDVGMVLNWGTEHVLSFFVKRLTAVQELTEKYEEPVRKLMPSSSGTAA